MRVVVARGLFSPQSAEEALALLRLLTAAAEDPMRNAVQTDPPYVPGTNNHETDTWLDARPWSESIALRHVLVSGNLLASATPRVARTLDNAAPPWWHVTESYQVVVERRHESDWTTLRLTLTDAIALVHEPVHLVLENEWNDFAFVTHLAGPTLGPTLRKLRDAPARLHVHGGGGGSGTHWLEELIQPPTSTEKWCKVLRAWVLFDQDAGETDAREPSAAAGRMRSLCEQVQSAFLDRLSWACLRRREIESYVPDSGLRSEATRNREALVRHVVNWRTDPISRPRAWAFDLKKGLRGDLRSDLSVAERRAIKDKSTPLCASMLKVPFDSLAEGDIPDLVSGFGDRALCGAMAGASPPAWTTEIPGEYDRGPAHQAPRHELIQSLFDRI